MQLYELIRSMTKSEKRHFKSYAKSGSRKYPKYLSLFDILCKADTDADRNIAKEDFTYDDRNLLMEKLLEALYVFRARNSVDIQIQMLISQAAILYEKNIWEDMDKRLQKAKKLAIEHERLLFLLQIIKMELDLVAVLQVNGSLLEEEQVAVRDRLSNEIDYDYIFYEITMVYQDDRTLVKSESRERIRQLASSPHLPDLLKSSSMVAKVNYHLIKYQYGITLNDEEKSVFHARQAVQLINENNFVFTARTHLMIYIYFFFLLKLEKYKQPFRKHLNMVEMIDNIPVESHYDLCFAYGFSLEYCILRLDKVQGELLISKMDTEGYTFQNHYNQNQLLILYQIMIFYGTFDEWEKAQLWFNQIVSIKRLGIRRNTKIKARFYSLIICYELGVDDFKTHLQSVQKYLQRNDRYTQTEREIIQNIADVQEAVRGRERLTILKRLYKLLEDKSNLLNEIHIPILQLKQWCKSKIEDISIAEVIRMENIR